MGTGRSQHAAQARAIAVPPRRIGEIIPGKPAVTADTDLRLTRYFGLSEGFFLRLQLEFDLRMQKQMLGKKLNTIKPAGGGTDVPPIIYSRQSYARRLSFRTRPSNPRPLKSNGRAAGTGMFDTLTANTSRRGSSPKVFPLKL